MSTGKTQKFVLRERVKSLDRGDRVGLLFGGGFPEMITSSPEVVTENGAPLVLEQLELAEVVYEPFEVAPLFSMAADWVRTGAAAGVGTGDGQGDRTRAGRRLPAHGQYPAAWPSLRDSEAP